MTHLKLGLFQQNTSFSASCWVSGTSFVAHDPMDVRIFLKQWKVAWEKYKIQINLQINPLRTWTIFCLIVESHECMQQRQSLFSLKLHALWGSHIYIISYEMDETFPAASFPFRLVSSVPRDSPQCRSSDGERQQLSSHIKYISIKDFFFFSSVGVFWTRWNSVWGKIFFTERFVVNMTTTDDFRWMSEGRKKIEQETEKTARVVSLQTSRGRCRGGFFASTHFCIFLSQRQTSAGERG